MVVRQFLHSKGFRYCLHYKSLPGKPDIAFPKLKTAIYIHGCFWHGHDCKKGTTMPKANAHFWKTKLARNRERDSENIRALEEFGWKVIVLWECRIKMDSLQLLAEELRPTP